MIALGVAQVVVEIEGAVELAGGEARGDCRDRRRAASRKLALPGRAPRSA